MSRRRKSLLTCLLAVILIPSILLSVDYYYSTIDRSGAGDPVERRIDKLSIEDGVAQLLMVGVPADHINYKQSKEVQYVIGDLAVGFVIMNTYNYYAGSMRNEEYASSISEFNKSMQKQSLKSKSGLPVLIATDFESPSYSSIKSELKIPPSALCIGASQNSEYAYMLGRLVGNQLRNVGIGMILGPVVDTYNARQGNKSTQQDRCFAGSLDGVISLSSHYLRGLAEGGVLPIIKHMPSYGSVEDNPHDYKIPQFETSKDALLNEIEQISRLAKMSSGVMTSHVEIPFLHHEKFATTSNEFIDKYVVAGGLAKGVIMTDDLTSMGAVAKYLKDNKIGYQELAIQAFDSGHDILLFSHFSQWNDRSQFTIKDLETIIKKLAQHIKTSEAAYKHYRTALRKVLLLKIDASERAGEGASSVLINEKRAILTSAGRDCAPIAESEEFLTRNAESLPKSADNLILATIRSALTLINLNSDYVIRDKPRSTRIAFCVSDEHLDIFKGAFGSLFPNASYIGVPRRKDGNKFLSVKKEIAANINGYDLIVYTVLDKSDADFLSQLCTARKDLYEKIIVFCHGNPIVFDDTLLRKATIVSHFTNHPLSFFVTVEALNGSAPPKGMDRLPLNLGEGGKFHSVTTNWPPAAHSLPVSLPTIRRDERISEAKALIGQDHIMIGKSYWSVIKFGVCVSLIYFLFAFFRLWEEYCEQNGKDSGRLYLICRLRIPACIFMLFFSVYLVFGDDLQILSKILELYGNARRLVGH